MICTLIHTCLPISKYAGVISTKCILQETSANIIKYFSLTCKIALTLLLRTIPDKLIWYQVQFTFQKRTYVTGCYKAAAKLRRSFAIHSCTLLHLNLKEGFPTRHLIHECILWYYQMPIHSKPYK